MQAHHRENYREAKPCPHQKGETAFHEERAVHGKPANQRSSQPFPFRKTEPVREGNFVPNLTTAEIPRTEQFRHCCKKVHQANIELNEPRRPYFSVHRKWTFQHEVINREALRRRGKGKPQQNEGENTGLTVKRDQIALNCCNIKKPGGDCGDPRPKPDREEQGD